MNLQNQLNAVYSLGMTMNAPSDQPPSWANGLFPRDNQMMHYTYPFNAYVIPYHGSPAVPPRHPNRNIPPQGAALDPYRHNSHNYGPPQMSQASNAGFPPPYGLNNPSQIPQAFNVGVPLPYGPNIPICNPPHMPLAPNIGYPPPYGPNIPIYNPAQMPRAPNIEFPPYGPNNPNYTPTQTPQALNPCNLQPGGYPIFYQPQQCFYSVPQRTGQHEQGVQNRGSGNVGQHNRTQGGIMEHNKERFLHFLSTDYNDFSSICHICVDLRFPKKWKRSVHYFPRNSELYKCCVSCGIECRYKICSIKVQGNTRLIASFPLQQDLVQPEELMIILANIRIFISFWAVYLSLKCVVIC